MTTSLQVVFAQNFQRDDVEGAKTWMSQWLRALDNPDKVRVGVYGYSRRAMAGHISDYLEGYSGDEPASFNGSDKSYYDTKYGQVIFNVP